LTYCVTEASLSPNGSLEKADFERLCREIDPYIAENGKLTGIMVADIV
jgi:hypothetical protein